MTAGINIAQSNQTQQTRLKIGISFKKIGHSDVVDLMTSTIKRFWWQNFNTVGFLQKSFWRFGAER